MAYLFNAMSDYNFSPELACKIGVDEAIMMQNITFWIKKNIANKKHFYDGRYWTYNSVEAFVDLFPFWTPKQIRRIMESLYSQEVVVKGNYNKQQFDRTGWYAVGDKYIYLLGTFDLPKRANAEPEKANAFAEKGNTIPYNKTDTSSFNKEDKTQMCVSEELKDSSDLFSSAGIGQPKEEKKDKKSSAKKRKESKPNILLREAPEFDFNYLKANIGEQYQAADLNYYYEAALVWSDKNQNTAKDWTATIRGFILRDRRDNKLVLPGTSQEEKLSTLQDAVNNWDQI